MPEAGAGHSPSTAWRSAGGPIAPDPRLDDFADLVANVLEAPIVVILELALGLQVVVAARGLGEGWRLPCPAPPGHLFSAPALTAGEPLVVADVGRDGRFPVAPVVEGIDIAALLAVPLAESDGTVLGGLAVLDRGPRSWTPRELDLLEDLAAVCPRMVERPKDIESTHSVANSQLLLAASEALTGTTTITDVLDVIGRLISGATRPANVHLALLAQDDAVTIYGTAGLDPDVVDQWSTLDIFAATPSTSAIRRQRPIFLSSRAEIAERFPAIAAAARRLGWQAIATAPFGPDPMGSLTLAWADERAFDVGEKAVIVTLASYVGQAVTRASRLAHRTAVAETLQRAMLTPMPRVMGYDLAARYRPAQRGERIGGDWYDAFVVSDLDLVLAIGDVSGHDINAAARMGELRSMLRAIALLPDHTPAMMLTRLEEANRQLGADTIATVVVATINTDHDGTHAVTWANAGHVPPVFIDTEGRVIAPDDHDRLIGFTRPGTRHDHHHHMRRGDTLLLLTDGLVEVRDQPIDQSLANLYRRLRAPVDQSLDALLDGLIADVVPGDHDDDIALIAVRPVVRAGGGKTT
jgi:serine phosphatase RsbU (regulator of sigma subunit)